MNDITKNDAGVYKDINMSYHLYGEVVPKGQNDSTLSNFVDQCYAEDLDIKLSKTNYADGSLVFVEGLMAYDENNNIIPNTVSFVNINNTSAKIKLKSQSFVKNLNGNAKIKLRYNFKRQVDNVVNPQKITFNGLDIKCSVYSNCQMIAQQQNSFSAVGKKNINDTIKFLYAKAHTPRTKINGNKGEADIFYEIYCYGSGCDKSLLPDGETSSNSDDPRWWINTKHTFNFGQAISITQRRTPSNVSSTTPSGNHPDKVTLTYNKKAGYPYRAVMQILPSSWLIYNKYNPNATTNDFEVEFHNDNSGWVGSGETDVSTTTEKNGVKDRTLTW
jgi:hypothetical protein